MDSGSDPAMERTAALASDASPSASDSAHRELEPGPEIGRYLVIDEIGAGGMGRVYRAYDPKLGREVALKRLRIASGDRTSSARMLREAKAMALLSHPNVVPIYDVDVDGGSLFISMEYVRGATLDAWLRETKPDWRGVLAMFVQAGRGLAAAHAQGLVHRDFKPSNVVVGEDARARVMDFGLARTVGDAGEPLPEALAFELEGSPSGVDLGATLTEHGTVVGTPRYMAPEQHLGEPVDARTDQYAFCVALWEALFHATAFKGKSVSDLVAVKLLGPPRPPSGTRTPIELHTILARGLDRDPHARWPDLPTLLAALERTATPRRWWIAAAVPIVAVPLALVWVTRQGPCSASERELDGIWDADDRGRVEAALLATGASFAASTIERVGEALDARAAEWTTMHHDACVATKVRHEQSDEALDLRMACLGERRRELGAVVDLLEHADAGVAEHAIELVAALTSVERCSDIAALRERVPPPELGGARESVEDVRARLQQARLESRAGRIDESLATAEAALGDARATEYEPAIVEAEIGVASTMTTLGRGDEAIPMLQHAFERALVHRDMHSAATAALDLRAALERKGARDPEVEWLIRAALGMAQGEGTDVRLEARALHAYGGIYADRDLELEALEYFTKATKRLEEELGPDHPDLIDSLTDEAMVLRKIGRNSESTALVQRALRIAETAYGPDHPDLTDPLQMVGLDAVLEGRAEEALEVSTRIVAIHDATLGAEHPSTISAQGMRAYALAELGRFPEAVAVADAAVAAMDRSMPEIHGSRANNLQNLAQVYGMAGDDARAVATLREVVKIRRAVGHQSMLASSTVTLGGALAHNGELDEAEAVLTEAMALEERVHADDGAHDTAAAAILAGVLRRKGELVRAHQLLEKALARVDVDDDDDGMHLHAQWELGQILWELDRDRPRAVAIVEKVLAWTSRASARAAKDEAVKMRKWLDTHVVPSPEDPLAK